MEQSSIKPTKAQKVEARLWTIGIILTCLIVGGILVTSDHNAWLVPATGGIYIAAGIALPTLLVIGHKQGKVHTPKTTTKDRFVFTASIIGLVGLGLAVPLFTNLFSRM